jgi:hypothetical protein
MVPSSVDPRRGRVAILNLQVCPKRAEKVDFPDETGTCSGRRHSDDRHDPEFGQGTGAGCRADKARIGELSPANHDFIT